MLPGPRRLSRVGVGTAVRRSKIRLVMSQLGHERRFDAVAAMSLLTPITEVGSLCWSAAPCQARHSAVSRIIQPFDLA